jgi:hypothetical protein
MVINNYLFVLILKISLFIKGVLTKVGVNTHNYICPKYHLCLYLRTLNSLYFTS